MPLNANEYRNLIVTQVGDSTTGVVAANVDTLWTLHDDQPTLPRQFLHAKRDAIQVLMGTVREQVTIARSGTQTDLTDKMRNLQAMLSAVDAEIATIETLALKAASQARPMSGQLTATAPRSAPDGWPDANDPALRGDPYVPLRWRR
jgi:hypothetical protein